MFKEYQEKPWKVFRNDQTLPIMKYGGASLSCSHDIKHLKKVIEENDVHFLVVSAMSGVTSKLEEIAHIALTRSWIESENLFEKEFINPHRSICGELELNTSKISSFARSHDFFMKKKDGFLSDLSDQEFVNGLTSFGEIVSREIVGQYLNQNADSSRIFHHLNSATSIFVDSEGRLEESLTSEKMRGRIDRFRGSRVIMEGYIAAKHQNLGRNGSDTTAAIAACELFKSGIYPSSTYYKEKPFEGIKGFVKGKRTVSYKEFLSTQFEGQQPYIHVAAVKMYQKYQIPFRILCKNDPSFEMIVSEKAVTIYQSTEAPKILAHSIVH